MDRLLGFDMQTVIQWGVQLLNTLILILLMGKILYDPVKKYLDDRKTKISKSYKTAEELLANAEMLKEWYEEKMRAADYDRLEILDGARERSVNMEKQILDRAKAEAETIRQRALRDIEMQKENSLAEMRRQIIDISTIIAEKYLLEKMDESTGDRLLEEAIDDLGDATWLN